MESRLEAYRAKKRQALEEKEKNERYWNLLTLAPLRQRVFGNANNQVPEHNVSNKKEISKIFYISYQDYTFESTEMCHKYIIKHELA